MLKYNYLTLFLIILEPIQVYSVSHLLHYFEKKTTKKIGENRKKNVFEIKEEFQNLMSVSESNRSVQKAVICCIPGTFSRALEGRLRECEVKVAGEQEVIEHLSR